MSDDDFAVHADDVSVRYHPRVSRAVRTATTSRRRSAVVQALDGVTFTIPRGEVACVIGRNGAGKSTLLRTIAGIVRPDRGRMVVRGRVSTLLSLNVGFNPKLSGRENVVLGGLAAGRSQAEIDETTADIIAFADLGEFIDYPISAYSAGMRSRLGFAVATSVDPDILLVDEVLGAGDAAFREKCDQRMEELCGGGSTVVLVTHGLATARDVATHCIWLDRGRVQRFGAAEDVVEDYLRHARITRSSSVDTV